MDEANTFRNITIRFGSSAPSNVANPGGIVITAGVAPSLNSIGTTLRNNAIGYALDMYALGERAPDWGADLDPGRKNWQTHTPNAGPITRKE